MSTPPVIKDPVKEDKQPTSLVVAVASALPMAKMMLEIAQAGQYKKLRKEKGFNQFPEVSVEKPKELDLERKFGKGKEFAQYMMVFADLLFSTFDALKELPDAETITAYQVVNYKSLLPKFLGTGDDYEIGLRVKGKLKVTEWNQLRDKSAKEIAALIPTVPEIVIVITKK